MDLDSIILIKTKYLDKLDAVKLKKEKAFNQITGTSKVNKTWSFVYFQRNKPKERLGLILMMILYLKFKKKGSIFCFVVKIN